MYLGRQSNLVVREISNSFDQSVAFKAQGLCVKDLGSLHKLNTFVFT